MCVHTCARMCAPSTEHAGKSLLHLTQSLLLCCVSSHLRWRVNQLLLNTRTANHEQAWSVEDYQEELAWVRSVGWHGPDWSESPKAVLTHLFPSTFTISHLAGVVSALLMGLLASPVADVFLSSSPGCLVLQTEPLLW